MTAAKDPAITDIVGLYIQETLPARFIARHITDAIHENISRVTAALWHLQDGGYIERHVYKFKSDRPATEKNARFWYSCTEKMLEWEPIGQQRRKDYTKGQNKKGFNKQHQVTTAKNLDSSITEADAYRHMAKGLRLIVEGLDTLADLKEN